MAEPKPALTPSLVFVPNLRVDRGMGHLKRCLAAASGARNAAVFLAYDEQFVGRHKTFDRSIVQGLAESLGARTLSEWPPEKAATTVCDLQAAPRSAFEFLRERSDRLIGWDEGGAVRDRFPFLIDSLPHDSKPPANLRLPGLLGMAISSDQPFERPIRKILAVFGGADPAGLTPRFLRFVDRLRSQGRWPYTLTVVKGPLSHFAVPPGTEVLDAPVRLAEMLDRWDLVVTSWGLTALESLSKGIPVLLFNPTSYHERLAQGAGLPTFGVREPSFKAFEAGLARAPEAARKAASVLLSAPIDAGSYFSDFQGSDGRCPVCRTAGHPVYFRTETKSYHRCERCGMEYLSAHQMPPKTYSEAYFFEDYQKQYGKTYLEDFPHIQGLGTERLSFLDRVAGVKAGRRILDAGCAYGPFLAAVAAAGHQPYGLDVAEGAVAHVRDVLGYPAVRESFLEFEWAKAFPGHPAPDVLTLWYVIEHFADLDRVLTQAHTIVPKGGVFAFSTPNGKGITRRFQPTKFWKESPDDHFSIWNPLNTKSVLRRYGFEVLAFRITGHHPERFPGLKSNGALLRLIAFFSRIWGWGDTFEVYARKTKEIL